MMPQNVSPRDGAARMRMVCIVAAILVVSTLQFASPALGASGRRRAAHPARRHHAQARRRVRHHRPRCVDSHARIGHVPAARIERATICLLNHERTERGLPRLRRSRL